MKRAFFGAALVAVVLLLVRSASVGLAAGYLDPAGKIKAQDEALYGSTAIHMAEYGDWLTPMFMGRYALYKPPLLIWVSALTARVLGVSTLSLRLPVAVASALSLGLILLWAAEMASPVAGICAAALLLSSRLWCVLGGTCMTDGLLAAFFTAAMYCLFSDPWLEQWWSFGGFAAAVAASVLDKSVAGALPLAVLFLYWLAGPRKERPSLGRVCGVAALAAALAAPWFLYEMAAHGRWFWTEHVAVEIFGFGAGRPPQTSDENRFLFYLARMPLIDPVLAALGLTALPSLAAACRKRSGAAILLACWMAVVLASVFAWQYRNLTYILPLFPALAVAAAVYGPFAKMRPAWWMLPLVGGAIALKIAAPDAPWGIPYRPDRVPVAPALTAYCERNRGNDLVEIEPADELYASALPLAKVRYAWPGEAPHGGRYALDFEGMGIILNAHQFEDLDKLRPQFLQRLREWGLDSRAPIGTSIFFAGPQEVARMVATHAESDFLLPEKYLPLVGGDAGHEVAEGAAGHFFLLSRVGKGAQGRKWACGL